MPNRVTIADPPLDRFKAIYAALERERRWWRDSSRLRYGALAAIACKGDAGDVARGIRTMSKALSDEFPWHWGVSAQVQVIVAASGDRRTVKDGQRRSKTDEDDRRRRFSDRLAEPRVYSWRNWRAVGLGN